MNWKWLFKPKKVFTDDEVASLNGYQACGYWHPFTCECGEDLIATSTGWKCDHCPYTQTWAHSWMKDWSWKKSPLAATVKHSLPRDISGSLSRTRIYTSPEPVIDHRVVIEDERPIYVPVVIDSPTDSSDAPSWSGFGGGDSGGAGASVSWDSSASDSSSSACDSSGSDSSGCDSSSSGSDS
jgi:hypothetical protein